MSKRFELTPGEGKDEKLNSLITLRPIMQPLAALEKCGGFYRCPRDTNGKRLGPLVGYAGRYENDTKQFVGDVYANFAKLEQWPHLMNPMAREMANKITSVFGRLPSRTVFCGMPEGGKAIATLLANWHNRRYLYPEKKVTKVATVASRERSEMLFSRHEIESGDAVILVEDVCNNMSTTGDAIHLVEEKGAEVIGITCLLNRSEAHDDTLALFRRHTRQRYLLQDSENRIIPIIALVREVMPQYKQDDPEVASDVASGNVVWKPKNEWAKLAEFMDPSSF